jgi:hypothetical protein
VALVVSLLAVAAGVLWLGCAAALASPPEAPVTEAATEVTASSAKLHGLLNPNAAGEGGGYRFTVKRSETNECEPGGFFRPESPALAQGHLKEEVSTVVTGLEPNAEYSFCVVASNLSAESTTGLPVQAFQTLPLAPVVDGESARVFEFEGFAGSGATLEAQVNPENEQTTYAFEYSTKEKGGVLEAPIVKVSGASALAAEYGEHTASVPITQSALEAGTTYYYRIVAENAQSKTEGKPVAGPVQSFTTPPSAQTEPVSAVTSTTATFHGTLNPLSETVATEYWFEYSPSGECTGGEGKGTTPVSAGTGSGAQPVSAAVTELQPSASYAVCLVSFNQFGFEVGPGVPFTTPAAPPQVVSESASAVSPFQETLEAKVKPNNQSTTIVFEYATSAGEIGTPQATIPVGASRLSGYETQTVSVSTGKALAANTTYYYRVIAENAAHEKEAGTVEQFTSQAYAAPLVEGDRATALGWNGASVEASVNPEYQETACKVEYAPNESELGTASASSAACVKPLGNGGEFVPVGPVSVYGRLEANKTYYYRMVASNATGSGGEASSFTTLIAPQLTTGTAQQVTRRSAVFSGSVNPSGVQTSYHYVYASKSEYEQGRKESPEDPYVYCNSTSEVPVGSENTVKATEPLTVEALAPGTVYHYAVVAVTTQKNTAVGTAHATVIGPDQTFTTQPPVPPLISSASVTNITQTAAMVSATVDGRGLPTDWTILVGTSPGDLQEQASGQTQGVPEAIEASVGSLAPGTLYYYRVAAANPDDSETEPESHSEGQFTTQQGPPPPTLAPLTTGVPLLSIPANAFPAQGASTATTVSTKPLTNKQKLAKALAECRKKHDKRQRHACERQAHKKYSTKGKK